MRQVAGWLPLKAVLEPLRCLKHCAKSAHVLMAFESNLVHAKMSLRCEAQVLVLCWFCWGTQGALAPPSGLSRSAGLACARSFTDLFLTVLQDGS